MMMAVFLDRDGVINEDRPDYVKRWDEFAFLPGSLEALRLLREQGCRIIVITNQSIVGRRMVSETELCHIHNKMLKAVAVHGGKIDAIFYCPHSPEEGCACRKPKPGLIYQARDVYSLDLSQTCMIGDSLKDMQCARTAGCGKTILVRTGYGRQTEQICREYDIRPDHVAPDLLGAVRWLLS
jgi:D-glycero-D-manno-heptose 1,7-bisphosphate phosphatase